MLQVYQHIAACYSHIDFGFELLYGIGITRAQYTLIRHLMCNTFCPTRRRYVSRDIVVDDVVLKMPGPPGLKRVVRHANQVMKEYGVKSLHNGTSIEASLLWEKTDKKALYQDNYGRYWIQIFFDACTSYKRARQVL